MTTKDSMKFGFLLMAGLLTHAPAFGQAEAPEWARSHEALSRSASALVLKATIPGRPAFGMIATPNESWRIDYASAFDFNGDGKPDRPMITHQDAPVRQIEIVDGADPENTWIVSLMEYEGIFFSQAGKRASPPGAAPGSSAVRGSPTWELKNARVTSFVDTGAGSVYRNIVLAERQGRTFVNPVVIDAEGRVLSPWDASAGIHFVAAADLDGDRISEIILYNPELNQVEVWGGSGN
jgi:hypothetical protein